MTKWIYAFLSIFFLSSYAQAATSVYQVEFKGHTIYLGGTVHILKESDYPLPEAYDHAYKQATTLVFETDIKEMHSGRTMGRMLKNMQYQDGRTIKALLKEDTYQLLNQHAKRLNIDLQKLKSFKPFALITMMLSVELQKMGVKAGGVDSFFFKKAVSDKKKTEGLETVAQQLEMISSMGDGNEDQFIRYSLDDFKNMKAQWHMMIQSWRTGEQDKMVQEFIVPMQKDPQLYQTLLIDRNQAWLPKIMHLLSDKPIEFVLVGSAHLVGKDGLLNQLRQKGCHIQQM
ncbi:MAG: TraB/GumN family protein [Mariprofundaceae bacterium]|nr:TraB/GumN family protein [Mariprofundaceae bacterium]